MAISAMLFPGHWQSPGGESDKSIGVCASRRREAANSWPATWTITPEALTGPAAQQRDHTQRSDASAFVMERMRHASHRRDLDPGVRRALRRRRDDPPRLAAAVADPRT